MVWTLVFLIFTGSVNSPQPVEPAVWDTGLQFKNAAECAKTARSLEDEMVKGVTSAYGFRELPSGILGPTGSLKTICLPKKG